MSVKFTRPMAHHIEVIRNSGACNMLDRPCVEKMLRKLGEPDTENWVAQNKTTYGHMIFEGIEIVDNIDEVDTDAKRSRGDTKN